MATIQEIDAKLSEYKTATADREAKQAKHEADMEAMNTAVVAEGASRSEWIDAIRKEHAIEDELEALIVAHEPPAVPT